MARRSPAVGEELTRIPTGPFLLGVASFFGVQLLRWAAGFTPPLDGSFDGADSYMRLVRVLECRGACPDGLLLRSNAPFGEVLHWPFLEDWLLLAIALPLRAILPFREAVIVAGYLWGPLLSIGLVAALMRIAALMLPQRALWFVGPLLATQLWVLGGFGPHGVDHHGLIALLFVLALAGALPVLAGQASRVAAVGVGLALGVGLWESVEMLVAAIPLVAALAFVWIRRGEPHVARWNRDMFGAATCVLVVALLVDGPRPDWLAAEYDRFSLPHVVLFGLATAFWAAVSRLAVPSAAWRGSIGAAGGVVICALTVLAFPQMARSPLADVPSDAFASWIDPTVEFMPAVRHDALWQALALGPLLFALPYCAWRAARGPLTQRGMWGLLLFIFVWFGVLAAFQQIRWTYYLHSLYPIALTGLLWDVLVPLGRLRSSLAVAAARLGAVLIALSAPVLTVFIFSATSAAGRGPCTTGETIGALLQLPDSGGVILADVFQGPEILYRTSYDVVATPYHRNIPGTQASHDIMRATDFGEARRLLEQRGVGWIATCAGQPWYPLVEVDAPGTLHAALQRGDPPEWLVRVALADADRVVLWRVTDR